MPCFPPAPRSKVLRVLPLVVMAVAVNQVSAQEYVGYVWDVRGTWLSGSDTLSQGSRITTQDSIAPADVEGELPVLIVVTEGGDRLRFVCDPPAACAAPIAPGDSLGGTAITDVQDRVGRIIRAVASLLPGSDQSSEFKPGYVREGYGSAESFRETVLLREGPMLDLTPLFENHEAGRYRVEVAPLGEEREEEVAEPMRSTLTWTPSERVWIESPTSGTGLHRVEVAKAAGLFSPETEVLVLVSTSEDYAQKSRDFEDAVAVTRSWSGAPEQEIRLFLRLYLQHLAANAPMR